MTRNEYIYCYKVSGLNEKYDVGITYISVMEVYSEEIIAHKCLHV